MLRIYCLLFSVPLAVTALFILIPAIISNRANKKSIDDFALYSVKYMLIFESFLFWTVFLIIAYDVAMEKGFGNIENKLLSGLAFPIASIVFGIIAQLTGKFNVWLFKKIDRKHKYKLPDLSKNEIRRIAFVSLVVLCVIHSKTDNNPVQLAVYIALAIGIVTSYPNGFMETLESIIGILPIGSLNEFITTSMALALIIAFVISGNICEIEGLNVYLAGALVCFGYGTGVGGALYLVYLAEGLYGERKACASCDDHS